VINWRYLSGEPAEMRTLAKELAQDLKEVLVDLGEGYECERAAALLSALDHYIMSPDDRKEMLASFEAKRGKRGKANPLSSEN
jgi:hypothetical protein